MKAAAKPAQIKIKPAYLIYAILCLLVLYVVLPQIGVLRTSLPQLRQANMVQASVGLMFALASYFAAAGVYTFVALKPLRYSRTLFMQFASMFTNRLLPAGLGGIGLNFLYLRRQRHTAAQAATVVSVNNSLGFIGHGLLLVILLMIYGLPLPTVHFQELKLVEIVVGILLLVIVVLSGRRVRRFLKRVLTQLVSYRHHGLRLAGALVCSLLLTLSTVLSFYLSCHAVGIQLPFTEAFLIFTFGLSVGTATPTPGSLGGIEAGLTGGLIAYHLPAGQALAAVLLYRLLTYWLPLAVGGTAFVMARQQRYF